MKILLLIPVLILLTSCPATMPLYTGRFYQGDSARVGITRNNPNEPSEFIPATDPEFDKYTCTKTQDLINYLAEVHKALSNCKWKGDNKE
jgi:hypothetical protein